MVPAEEVQDVLVELSWPDEYQVFPDALFETALLQQSDGLMSSKCIVNY